MGILDSAMEITKLATQLANPELLREVSKVNVEALAISKENLELHGKIRKLEDEVRELRAREKVRGKVYRLGEFVYTDGDPYPLCSACWDQHQKLIHLTLRKAHLPLCPVCNKYAASQPPGGPTINHPGAILAGGGD